MDNIELEKLKTQLHMRFNPNHDEKGKFTTGSGGDGASLSDESYKKAKKDYEFYANKVKNLETKFIYGDFTEQDRIDFDVLSEYKKEAYETYVKERKKLLSDPEYEKKRDEALRDAEQKIMNEPVEHAYVFDAEGNQVFYAVGDAHSVDTTSFNLQDAVDIHNHPLSSPKSVAIFSPEDITSFYDDEHEMRVITRTGVRYSLKEDFNSYGTINDKRKFVSAYESAWNRSTKKIRDIAWNDGIIQKTLNGEISEDEYNGFISETRTKLMTEYLKKNAPKYGLIFTEERVI